MTGPQPIILAQTAAGPAYERMLAATAELHRDYCARFGLTFDSTTGLRRGFHPWQASFNRIEIIADLLDRQWQGWFLYLDADCVIRQPQFDIVRYLDKRADSALIAARAAPGSEWWDINNGIFFLNLAHPLGREIGREWHRQSHAAVDDEMLRAAEQPWQNLPDGSYFPDDQHLLHVTLRDRPYLRDALLLETGGLINSAGGRFIQQIMRHVGGPEERLAWIEASVAAVRSGEQAAAPVSR